MGASNSTPDLLIDAAARLFAERGVDNVSIADIVRSADQRNTSAVHYHFGSRDDILLAVLTRHVGSSRRGGSHFSKRRRRGRPVRSARRPRPLCARLPSSHRAGGAERAYLQIGSDLAGAIDRVSPEIRELLGHTAGGEAWDLLRQRCPKIPSDLWRARREICIAFIGRAAADRARELGRGGKRLVLSDDRFVDNLVEMLLGAMRAPHGVS